MRVSTPNPSSIGSLDVEQDERRAGDGRLPQSAARRGAVVESRAS